MRSIATKLFALALAALVAPALAQQQLNLGTQVRGTLSPANGGTGIANNPAATITRSGNHPVTITTTGSTAVTLPTTGTLATTEYVDTVSSASSAALQKANCDFATVSNDTLSGLADRDGVTPTAGMRACVFSQTAGATNGIFIADPGAWPRATDADTWAELVNSYVFVEQGATRGNTIWVNSNDAGGTLGTTAVTFSQASGGAVTGGIPVTGSNNITGTLGHTTTTMLMAGNLGGAFAPKAPQFTIGGCSNFPGVNVGAPSADSDNTVCSYGWNMARGNGRLDVTKPAIGLAIENNFLQSGQQMMEMHLTTTDTSGVEHRLWSTIAPRDGTTGAVQYQRADKINMAKFASPQTTFAQWDFSATGPRLWMASNSGANTMPYIYFETNNTPGLKQLNAAASTVLNLPYINNENRLRMSQPPYAVDATPTTGGFANIFAVLQPTSLPVNGIMLYAPGPTVAGAAQAFRFDGNFSGGITGQIKNNNATSGGHAILDLYAAASGGSTFVTNSVAGVPIWANGTDTADSNKFKWGNGATPATNTRMTLDTSGNLTITGKHGSPLSTPSASTDACTAGQMWADTGFVYVCTATNTIKRAALSTF